MGTDQDWDKYKATNTKSRYKKRFRYGSTNSWRNFCINIETTTQANRVRKVLSNNSAISLGSLRKSDNSFTRSAEEVECILLKMHLPNCEITRPGGWPDEKIILMEEEWRLTHKVIDK